MHKKTHPVAQIIENLGESVGMAVVAPAAEVHLHSEAELDERIFARTRLTVDSFTESRDGVAETTHTITVVGAPDAADGTPGLKAPPFARLICRMIEEVTGEHIGREVMNKEGDRRFIFTHEDVEHGRSQVERQLLSMKEKLLAPGNEQYLNDFKALLKLAQKMETSFSDNPKLTNPPAIATRIVPAFRIGDQGVPVLGLEVQTNHPRLRNQFVAMQNQGVNNSEIPGVFHAVIAGDRNRSFAGGRLIKAEGPSALATVNKTVEALLDPKHAAQAENRQLPHYDSSVSSFGHTL